VGADERDASRATLVTAAKCGIVFEVCRRLVRGDMRVVLGTRDSEQGESATKKLSGEDLEALYHAVDVSEDESVGRLAAWLEEEIGKLDVLVTNAATYVDRSETVVTTDLSTAHKVLNPNLFGAWRACQTFLPLIRRSAHGRIFHVPSGAGSPGDPQFGQTTNRRSVASYGISEAALNALTARLAAELEGAGILANSVCSDLLTGTVPGMGEMGVRPLPKVAASLVWAATLPDDGPTGSFFRDGKPLYGEHGSRMNPDAPHAQPGYPRLPDAARP
jgi:NAD(P)-dependent dehydrogenase (short-subunit alcohol dehydrogenase family)